MATSLIPIVPERDATLPPPEAFGAPPQFAAWREYQADVAYTVGCAEQNSLTILQCPTGFGKSLAYTVGALMQAENGQRVCILVGTKALQDQLSSDFPDIAVVKGRAAFTCATNGKNATLGACRLGGVCMAEEQCEYKRQLIKARDADVVLANYSVYLAHVKQITLGIFDMLICDEAHDIERWIDAATTVMLPYSDMVDRLEENIVRALNSGVIGTIALRNILGVVTLVEKIALDKEKVAWTDRLYALRELLASAGDSTTIEFVVRVEPKRHWEICAVDTQYLTQMRLLGQGKALVLASATVTQKTLHRLGISKARMEAESAAFITTPSPIPVEQRRVYYVPTVRVVYTMSREEEEEWLRRIEEIVRLAVIDREENGIIHAQSYNRAARIAGYLCSHGFRRRVLAPKSYELAGTVERFKAEPNSGLILISPAITTGYDFPGAECRYQIIAKIPYPNTKDPVVAARVKKDKGYLGYLAAMTLQQAVGRSNRGASDWSRTYIVDDSWKWFCKKNAQHFTEDFMSAVTTVRNVEATV